MFGSSARLAARPAFANLFAKPSGSSLVSTVQRSLLSRHVPACTRFLHLGELGTQPSSIIQQWGPSVPSSFVVNTPRSNLLQNRCFARNRPYQFEMIRTVASPYHLQLVSAGCEKWVDTAAGTQPGVSSTSQSRSIHDRSIIYHLTDPGQNRPIDHSEGLLIATMRSLPYITRPSRRRNGLWRPSGWLKKKVGDEHRNPRGSGKV